MSELYIANPKKIIGFVQRMAFVVAATMVLVYFTRDFFGPAFMSNVALNGTILFVFILGTFLCFLYVLHLKDDVRVVAMLDEILFDNGSGKPPPKLKMHLLSSTVRLLKNNIASLGLIKLSAPATKALIDSLQDSLDEKIAFVRYFTDLLVFIGLLGTFLGLTITIGSIGGILSDLAKGLGGDVDIMVTLVTLIKGLEGPLGGMSTAFGSSLMGLSTSLVLGILLLHLNKASSYFSSSMESWLAQHTVEHLPGSGGGVVVAGGGVAVDNGSLGEVVEQLHTLCGLLQGASGADAYSDVHWQDLKSLINHNHNELASQTARMSGSVDQLSQHLKTLTEMQANQMNQAELQLRETEKLRQLFATQADASIEALGAVSESKHRLVHIVNTMLDEQKAQQRSQAQASGKVDAFREQVEALSEKVETESQSSKAHQTRLEKMFQALTKAVDDLKHKIIDD